MGDLGLFVVMQRTHLHCAGQIPTPKPFPDNEVPAVISGRSILDSGMSHCEFAVRPGKMLAQRRLVYQRFRHREVKSETEYLQIGDQITPKSPGNTSSARHSPAQKIPEELITAIQSVVPVGTSYIGSPFHPLRTRHFTR